MKHGYLVYEALYTSDLEDCIAECLFWAKDIRQNILLKFGDDSVRVTPDDTVDSVEVKWKKRQRSNK